MGRSISIYAVIYLNTKHRSLSIKSNGKYKHGGYMICGALTIFTMFWQKFT